jgi:hypothetical protein
VVEQLGDPEAVLLVDETDDQKGTATVGGNRRTAAGDLAGRLGYIRLTQWPGRLAASA